MTSRSYERPVPCLPRRPRPPLPHPRAAGRLYEPP
jgi:hypothetical protein